MNKHVAFTVTVWPKVSSTSTKGCGTCKAINARPRPLLDRFEHGKNKKMPPRSCVAIGEHQATGGIDDKTNTKTSDNGGFILLRKTSNRHVVGGKSPPKWRKYRNCLKSLPKLNYLEFFNVIAVIAPGQLSLQ